MEPPLSRVAVTARTFTGAHAVRTGKNVTGTYTYHVCETGTTNGSNEAFVTF